MWSDHTNGVLVNRTLAAVLTASFILPVSAFAGKQSSITLDDDGDGVINAWDMCPGSDDTVDLDGNLVSDCTETLAAGPSFNNSGDLQYWQVSNSNGSSMGWTPTDGSGYANSGSFGLGVSNQPGTNVSTMTWSDCIPVNSHTQYNVLMQAKSQTLASGHKTQVEFWEYDSSSCAPNDFTGRRRVTSYGAFSWKTIGSQFLTDNSTRGVRVGIVITQTGSNTTTHYAWVDNVLVSPISGKTEGPGEASTK